MNVKALLEKGLVVPKKVLIPQASVDDTGKVYVGIGLEVSKEDDSLQFFGGVKWRPSKTDQKLATGIANAVNTLRAEIADTDDTPGVFTLSEGASAAMAALVGKR